MREKYSKARRVIIFIAAFAIAVSALTAAPTSVTENTAAKTIKLKGSKVKITYIDVGQGDSTLIQLPDKKNILIDAGEYTAEDAVINTLKERKVKKINYLIATHPDSDHIGGMQYVIRNFKVGRVLMSRATKSTQTFSYMMDAIKEKGVSVKKVCAGMYLFNKAYRKKMKKRYKITARFLAPKKGENYSSCNNYSTVLKLKFNKRKFLFSGDAETLSEGEMVEGQGRGADFNLSADVLKVGHHGSTTATSAVFLNAVSPGLAIISCGKGNRYGHPHAETLARLKEFGAVVLRTDLCGTITVISNGRKIVYCTQR